MESEKDIVETKCVPVAKPNYMLMSLQRIFVLIVILASVMVVVYYTPTPGQYIYISIGILCYAIL